jgi:dGTPase
MDWLTLLSPDRLGRERKARTHDPARSEFRRDSDRITFSSAFRRLQDKTQVFPLADNDYVRTRLTHSLEVASVARSLATRIGGEICARHGLRELHASDFGEVASAAALAHDLGNPPFGHSGEDAIRHWFNTSPHAQRAKTGLNAAELADIDRYEGNAQGFRLITRLQMPDNPGGLQLTCATLGAFTKYPRESVLPTALPGASAKKFGFFQSEAGLFAEVAERCGLPRREARGACWARHPLAFVVEAADDISYRLVDLEDGCRLDHVSYEEAKKFYRAVIAERDQPRRLDAIATQTHRVQLLRTCAIGSAIEACAELFLAREHEILAGTFDEPLIDAIPNAAAWEEIIRVSRERIYSTPRGVEIEAAGFEVLGGLLDVFVSALNEFAEHPRRSKKLLQLVPAETLGPAREPLASPYERLLRMLDFVSGMTDSYAVSLYKKVRGISLPGQ